MYNKLCEYKDAEGNITYYYCNIVIFLSGSVVLVAPPGPSFLLRWRDSVSRTRVEDIYTFTCIGLHRFRVCRITSSCSVTVFTQL